MKTRIFFTFLVSFCFSCPHSWYEFPSDDVCVYIIKKSQNYTATVNTCAQLNSSVVKITNIFENAYLGALLSKLNDEFPFIGVERKSNGTWVYQDGNPLIYTNWAPGEPSLNSSLNRVYLGEPNLQWYATDCSTQRPSFCSAKEMPNHECLDGWIYSNETDYCYYLENFTYPDNIHWAFYDHSEAEANCQRKDIDSHLVSIHSDAENKFVYGRTTPSKMPFEMRKLTSFPMENLCYDLKLEVLEKMETKDALELVKVNAGFRSILLRTPWIAFGHHVVYFEFIDGVIRIVKFPTSSPVQLDADLHLPLMKRIHSCDALWVVVEHNPCNKPFSHEHVKILNQLNSVKRLVLLVDINESLLKFLENFRSMIEESAYIDVKIDLFKENQVISELFKNFIANQMTDCEEVKFSCDSGSAFHFYHAAFAKVSIKFLEMSDDYDETWDEFEEIVQSIVKKRIPSQNLKAAFYGNTTYSQEMNARLVDFLSQFPGMKRLDGENQQEVTKIATELFEKRGVYWADGTERLFVRRNIDSSRDCVYMLSSDSGDDFWKWTRFFAFYVQAQSERMEF